MSYCPSVAEQRKQVLYLLQELGFDTAILQGASDALAFDDIAVIQRLKEQLAKLTDDATNRMLCAITKELAKPFVVDTVATYDCSHCHSAKG